MNRVMPIIFSAPMIRSLLAGDKTQTRRLAWRDTEPNAGVPKATVWQSVNPGDRLYVRENFAYVGGGDPGILLYAATWQNDAIVAGCDQPLPVKPPKWTPCIHMPRKISRITLTVTATKIEPLLDINEADAVAEGMMCGKLAPSMFLALWAKLHAKCDGAGNPQVVALTFAVEKRNIDA